MASDLGNTARDEHVQVPVSTALDIVSWWRAANEAPGGCSSRDAIKGMGDAVYAVALLLREAGHAI